MSYGSNRKKGGGTRPSPSEIKNEDRAGAAIIGNSKNDI